MSGRVRMMVLAFAGPVLALLSVLPTGAAMASPAPPPAISIACSAEGTKLVGALSPAAACQRFVAAFAAASGRPAVASSTPPDQLRDGLIVALRFLPQGLAMASATPVRAGSAGPQQRHELAVSDRAFAPADIDRLAADTAKGITAR